MFRFKQLFSTDFHNLSFDLVRERTNVAVFKKDNSKSKSEISLIIISFVSRLASTVKTKNINLFTLGHNGSAVVFGLVGFALHVTNVLKSIFSFNCERKIML